MSELTELDVVGIGALNLDYLADLAGCGQTLHDLGTDVERGTERRVGDTQIREVLGRIPPSSMVTSPGGSAFNTVHALARVQSGLNLGYVGVAGRRPTPGPATIESLRRLGVDTGGVLERDDVTAGICVSLLERGDRTLLIHPGANLLIAGFIEAEFERILAYLGRAEVVHVTSFLDRGTPPALLRLLTELKRQNPSVLLSFDPGHEWSMGRSAAVSGMLGLSDLVLVNEREFRGLGAEDLTGRIAPAGTVLLKRPAGVDFRRRQGDSVVRGSYPHEELPAAEIRDATGAGDVFAAGLLAVLCRDPRALESGARLGLALARHRLRHFGDRGHRDFAGIAGDFPELQAY